MKNKQKFLESNDTFSVIFDGSASIDASIFTSTIDNTINLVKASTSAIDPNAFLRLEIKANKDGSFITIINAIVKYTPDLFTKENATLACVIIGGVSSFFTIKQHLKGKKPKDITQKDEISQITNQDGIVISQPTNIVDKYFQNCKVESFIINIFTDLDKEKKEAFHIEHKGERKSFTKNEYKELKISIIEDGQPIVSKENVQTLVGCELTIKKPDLIGNSKWSVILDKQIDVRIEDEEFLSKIRGGEIKLSGGHKLICDLEIKTELDKEFNVLSAEYCVYRVKGIKNALTQLTMDI